MFRIAATLFFLLTVPLQAEETRISVLWVHYSVGRQFVTAECHINEKLDTLSVVVGDDKARIVFRDYYTNYEKSSQNYTALTDTTHNGCDRITISNFDYDLMNPYNRIIINYNETSRIHSGIMDYMFNVPNKEQQDFWNVFTLHNIPGANGDSVMEHYDLVIIKNPYLAWFNMTEIMSDSIKMFYEALRDSISNHPEMNIALAFGTPLILGHECNDSSVAKITYDLCQWFKSEQFFTHNNFGPYRNLWKFDCYSYLCEMNVAPNRYCLKTEYNGGGGSHLSELGEQISQDSLVALVGRVARDILMIKGNTEVTVGDVNQDYDINLLDLLYIIAHIYNSPAGPAPIPYESGDINGDNTINIIDVFLLINLIYGTDEYDSNLNSRLPFGEQ